MLAQQKLRELVCNAYEGNSIDDTCVADSEARFNSTPSTPVVLAIFLSQQLLARLLVAVV